MESQPQNPEFRNNPENFHPCTYYFCLFPECDQFSTTFTKIENIYINKYNLADYSDKSKDECQQLCIDFGNTCVEFDYWKDDNKCFLGSTTYQQILDADPTQIKSWNEFDLYTRNCAT